jgi:hypothetical protein
MAGGSAASAGATTKSAKASPITVRESGILPVYARTGEHDLNGQRQRVKPENVAKPSTGSRGERHELIGARSSA